MIKVIAKRKFKKENLEKALKLYSELVDETRKEKGCQAYDLFQDIKNECILTMIEEWESEEHLKAHFNTEHFTRIVPQIAEIGEDDGQVNINKKVK